jgi:hypothetical protein
MSKVEIQVYLLVPLLLQDESYKSVKVWKEISRNVIIDARTSAQDILNALMQKRIPTHEFKYFSLYLTANKNSERRFIRSLGPTELPLILMLHWNSKNYDFYIKKKDDSERVSMFLDLRKELMKTFSKDQLQTRLLIASEAVKQQKSKLFSRYKREMDSVKDKMTESGFDILPGM